MSSAPLKSRSAVIIYAEDLGAERLAIGASPAGSGQVRGDCLPALPGWARRAINRARRHSPAAHPSPPLPAPPVTRAVKSICSDDLTTPGPHTPGEVARRVRGALDADAALSLGGGALGAGSSRGWSVVVGRAVNSHVSARVKHYAHLSVAGVNFLVWRA